MSVSIECPACGYVWTVDAADLRAGTWQRHCPNCRPTEPDDEEFGVVS